MSDEREIDLVVFTDDSGQEIQMEVIGYFEYEGDEYAMLVDADEASHSHVHDHEHDDKCCHDSEEEEIYIMKIDSDTEEFIPVEEDMMDDLIAYIQKLYDEEYGDEFEEDFEDDEEE